MFHLIELQLYILRTHLNNVLVSLSVITGKVTSLTSGATGSVTVEVSLIRAYKMGLLNLTKSGPVKAVTLTSSCKRCPGLIKGTEFIVPSCF